MIACKKAEGQRKHQAIAHCTAGVEEQRHTQQGGPDAFFLIGIERRLDEKPQFHQQVREHYNQRQPKGGLHMGEERCGDVDIDDVDVEIRRENAPQSLVHKEIATCRSEDYGIEDAGHCDKGGDKDDSQGDDHPENRPAEHLQVVPEAHFAIRHHFFSSLLSVSISALMSSSSLRTSFIPSLKLFTPLPRPRISSGIFLPPKSSSTTRATMSISPVPIFCRKSRFPISNQA